MQFDSSGRVLRWNDHRRAARAVAGQGGFLGAADTVTLRTPDGATRTVRALRCRERVAERCSYALIDSTVPAAELSLDHSAYTVLGVVRRTSDRGDNYFVMTTGRDCSSLFGGTGCHSNSALHLGWSGGRTVRLGQYDNDVVIDRVPEFSEARSLPTLFSGSSTGTIEKVRYFDSEIYFMRTGASSSLLMDSGTLMVGGTAFTGAGGPGVPDWRFDGQIFAVLVYKQALTDALLVQAESYLRNRFGPR
jgi:hypothetical protein